MQRSDDSFLELIRVTVNDKGLLKFKKKKGYSSLRMSLISQVGAGSDWHVLFTAYPMSFSTSSPVTALHSVIVGAYNGVAAVDHRTRSTLSLKNIATIK